MVNAQATVICTVRAIAQVPAEVCAAHLVLVGAKIIVVHHVLGTALSTVNLLLA